MALPSGMTIGVLAYPAGTMSVIDLSGSSPSKVDYAVPVAYQSAYAATSITSWIIGNQHGVIVDGASVSTGARYFGLGAAWSIAGGTGRVAIATASGQILFFDPAVVTPEGTIKFSSSKIAMSSDGTVLAAAADNLDSQYEPDRTLKVFSLPAATLINSWPYSYNPAGPTLFVDFSLAASATTIGQVFQNLPGPGYVRQVTAVTGGPLIWSDTVSFQEPIRLSPDGTLIAASNAVPNPNYTTNIYKNGALITAVPGWAVGWLDNDRLLVNTFIQANPGPGYGGAAIFNTSSGTNLGTLALPQLGDIQPVTSDSIYSEFYNTIYSTTTGAATWTSPAESARVGAISGPYVVFASGNLVIVGAY
jgi:hypothetical protein